VSPEQLGELLRYRMEQAHETLREADILLNESALRGTVNRALNFPVPFIWPLSVAKHTTMVK
jgi:hypothetical protein